MCTILYNPIAQNFRVASFALVRKENLQITHLADMLNKGTNEYYCKTVFLS